MNQAKQDKKWSVRNVVFLVIGVLILIALVTPSESPAAETTSAPASPTVEAAPAPKAETKPEPAQANSDFANLVEREFMAGCTGEGATNDMCRCMYNYLVSEYGVDGVVEIGSGSESEMEEVAIDAAIACL